MPRVRSKPKIGGEELLDMFVSHQLNSLSALMKDADEMMVADKAAIERAKQPLNIVEARKTTGARPRRAPRGAKRPMVVEY